MVCARTTQFSRYTSAAVCGIAGTPCLVPQNIGATAFGTPTATSGPEPCNSRSSSSRPTDCSGDGFTNFTCQVTASYSITIGSGCTRRWAIDPQKNSTKRPNPRPNLEARRWSFLRTKRTAKRILKDCWGRGLKRRPLPQTPTLARRCKDVDIKSETVPKVFVTL